MYHWCCWPEDDPTDITVFPAGLSFGDAQQVVRSHAQWYPGDAWVLGTCCLEDDIPRDLSVIMRIHTD